MNLQENIRKVLREETELPLYIIRRVSVEDLDDLVLYVKSLIDSDYDKIDAIYDAVRQFIVSKRSFKFNNETEQQYWDSYVKIEKPLVDFVKSKLNMNLQESIRRILREEISNRGKDKLIHMIKTLGFDKTSKAVGGIDNLKKITGIHNSYQFMKLFLGLTPKESEDDPETILYKNDEGVNVFLYTYLDDDKDNVYMFYLNYDLVYKPLGIFRETKLDGQKLEFLQKWLKSNYNIKVNEWDIDNYRPGDYLEYLN